MIVAALSVVAVLRRTRGTTNRFRGIALLVTQGGMHVNMLMRRTAVLMDMHMGVPGTKAQQPDAARQPREREQRSEHSNDQHGGSHSHRRMVATHDPKCMKSHQTPNDTGANPEARKKTEAVG